MKHTTTTPICYPSYAASCLWHSSHLRSFDAFPKLKTFLSSPLPVKYPTMEENLSETFSEVFEYSTDKIVVPSAFENATTQHFNFSDAENANITLWDMFDSNTN